MSQFLFTYRAPEGNFPSSPETVTDEMRAAWQAYFEGIGSNVVEVGNPVYTRTSIGNAAADTVLRGYSVVEADGMDAAKALAEGCPLLKFGGGVEIGELGPVTPQVATSAGGRATSVS